MALMAFGIVLNRNGWRIEYLGTSTPVEELTRAADASLPDLVVLAATLPDTLEPLRSALTSLARRGPLALAGAGVTPEIASAVGPGSWRATRSLKPSEPDGRGDSARARIRLARLLAAAARVSGSPAGQLGRCPFAQR